MSFSFSGCILSHTRAGISWVSAVGGIQEGYWVKRGCTHLRGIERGCLPERCRALQKRWTPLFLASQDGHAAVVKQLLAAGGAADAKTTVRGSWGGRGGLGDRTLLCVSSGLSCFVLLIIGFKLTSMISARFGDVSTV